MKEIALSQNKVALVDDEDFEWVNQWKWHAFKSSNGLVYYAVRSERVDGKQRRIWLHRLLLGLGPGDGLECDHRNGNGLDNRRVNIRRATRAENNRNRGLLASNKSGCTGVSWHSRDRMWQAHAIVDGRWTNLGQFTSKDDAIAARREAAGAFYGEFTPTDGLLI
jgi:HNH endonuclease